MSLSELLNKPKGCEICGSERRLVEDHCHETNEFRGWLCGHCNTGLGMFADDIGRLNKAIEYLQKPPTLALDSLRAIAAKSGHKYDTVKKWFQRGRIPVDAWMPLIEASNGAITPELLMRINKPRKERVS